MNQTLFEDCLKEKEVDRRKERIPMASMLTTIDNPFDPFTQFDSWFQFDEQKGYHTCQFLAKISKASSEMSQSDYEKEIERAIDEIVKFNVRGIDKKVTKDV